MVRTRKVKTKRSTRTPTRSNDRQTLGERIKWLRAKSNPYMTLKQLATLSGIPEAKLFLIEKSDPKFVNLELNTLRKIAHALDCKIFINLKRKPSPLSEECLPLGHDLPPIPKLKRKWTEAGHRLAVEHGSYPWKNYRRKKRQPSPKSTSDKPSLKTVQAIDEQTG